MTGGAGFIGSHLVDRLVCSGCKVKVLDNLSTGKVDNIRSHLDSGMAVLVEGDVRDASIVEKAMQDCDAVVHLAAVVSVPYSVEHPDVTFNVNVAGTLNVLRSCVEWRVGKMVFASSCAVYGEAAKLPASEETDVAPILPYAESKLAAEHYCRGFSDVRLLPTVVLRFFNVYGPRQGLSEYAGVITRFIDNSRRGAPLIVYGDGSQTRDFVNVQDVVDAIFRSLERDEADGQVFNVGSGKPTTLEALAHSVVELNGSGVGICHESPREGDIKNSYGEISKVCRLLGYRPKVALKDGLRQLLSKWTLSAVSG